ncbi:MAG: sulfurtransferase-like selenium metabolism protein YedF [Eubacteriales bacterium]|nr:sulfurtransferase-like selenium metabolism protein YedF [Eubacteriales bacterium]
MNKFVDAMGDACPIPVVKTKNAIKELGAEGGSVETLVDNEIAVQNLTKMANQKGYGVSSEKLEEQKYKVTMVIGGTETVETVEKEEPVVCIPDARKKNTLVVISSDCMGEGDPKLGEALMKSFIYALTEQDELPACMLFYNGGAKVSCKEGPIMEDLKSLEAQGVEILTCGTCLNHYGLSEELKVGGVTNMYVIVEKMMQADLIIKP